MQLLPSPQLRHYVKHYLWISKPAATLSRLHIFGDGNPGIVFCCRCELYHDNLIQEVFPPVFGYGQINSHRTILANGNIELLIAVLQPFALSALLKTSAMLLDDLILDEQQLFSGLSIHDIPGIIQSLNLPAKVNMLDLILGKLFAKPPDHDQQLLTATLQRIQDLQGRLSSRQLIHFTGFSERYLEKKFKEHIGLSPKKFARITRILTYVKTMDDHETFTAKACKAGFYDQAHLNHEFKKLTGLTPTTFSRERQALALNFFNI